MSFSEQSENKITQRFATEDQESNETAQLNEIDYEQQQKQKQKILMNELLFSYDEGQLSEEIDDQQEQNYPQIQFKKPNLKFPQNKVRNKNQKKKGKSASLDVIKSEESSSDAEEKNSPFQRRNSLQDINIAQPKIQFMKEFELEMKEGDSMPQSENDQSEGKYEQNNHSFQDDLENSQILNLKRKQSKKIFNSSDSSTSSSDERREHGGGIHNKKQYYLLRQNVKETVNYFLGQARGVQSTPKTNKMLSKDGSSRYLDPMNIIFFFEYFLVKGQQENMEILHNLVKKITEKDIKLLQKWKLYDDSDEIKQDIWNGINQISSVQFSDKIQLGTMINNLFVGNIQHIFESSVVFSCLEEFKEIQDILETKLNCKYSFVLKKEIIEILLNLENEKYIKIIYEGNFVIDDELSQDFLQIFQSNFSPEKIQNKLTLSSEIMVFYYSVELLSPQMIRYIISLEDNQNVLRQILHYFILYHLNQSAKETFQKLLQKKEDMENEIVQLCLQSSNFAFLYTYYDITRTKVSGWLEDGEYQKILIKALGRSTGMNFQALLFFIRKVKLWSQKNLIHLLAETLSERLDSSQNDNHFLFTFSNPFKIIVLILEILNQLFQNETFHKNILERTQAKFNVFATTLIKQSQDEEQMRRLLIDWDLEGRKLLYIIYENSLSKILTQMNVQGVIDNAWNGNANSTINIFNSFSVCQNLFYSLSNKFLKDKEKIYFSLNKLYQKEDFMARQSIWIKQIKFRYFSDQILIFILNSLLLAYFLVLFPTFTQGFMPISDSPDVINQTIQQIQNQFSSGWIILLILISANYPLNAISNLIFLKQFEKNAFFTKMQIFEFLYGIVAIYFIIFIYTMQNYSFQDAQSTMVALLNIMTIFAIMRNLTCLTVTKTFGPVFQAGYVIVVEVSKFMTIFVTYLLLFTIIGLILFNQLPSGRFVSFDKAYNFLVEAMFGQFQFAQFSSVYPAAGYLYMMAYLYIYGIVLMNALVAILTFNFENKNRQSKMLHYEHTIFHIRQGNYIQKHGCLILLPFIIKFAILPYLFLKQVFSSKSAFLKSVQKFYINLSYSPFLLLTIFVCLTVNFLLTPLAYFQHMYQISKQVCKKTLPSNVLLKWMLLGLYIILKQTFFEDLKEFYLYMCAEHSCQDKENQLQKKIVYDSTMRKIFQTINTMYINGVTYCTISELFSQIKEDFQNYTKQIGKESCVDEQTISGVHLLKRQNLPSQSPNIEVQLKKKPSSTPLQLHLLQKKNSVGTNVQRIDKINVKLVFQGISELEEDCVYFYEYFERFCFKDIARNEEQRDQVLNLYNILKLHENYNTSQLKTIIHTELYQAVKLT
ncbi:hypothetical protein ABPG74_005071 [Tetrahymena malaccensis]